MSVQAMVAAFFMVAGSFFLIVAAIGFIRLPDVFCRLHVNGVIESLGGPLVLFGTAVYLVPGLVSLKLLIAIVFLVVTGPLVGHLLARAALEAGHQPGVIDEASDHRFGQILAREREKVQRPPATEDAE